MAYFTDTPARCLQCNAPFTANDLPEMGECLACRWLGCEMDIIRYGLVEGKDYWLDAEYPEGYAYSTEVVMWLAQE